MKHALLLENVVDQCILQLNDMLKTKFADTSTKFNWADWNR